MIIKNYYFRGTIHLKILVIIKVVFLFYLQFEILIYNKRCNRTIQL